MTRKRGGGLTPSQAADAGQDPPPWSRPIFRWAGSKKGVLHLLRQCAPSSYNRYIEPFAGSACLFFALNPRRAVLADFNAELMHAYRVLAMHPRIVTRTATGLPEDDTDYYAIRAIDPDGLSEIDRAARFLYLNRHCFNGVYRTDRKNRFNVPRGTRAGQPLSEAEAVRCSLALRRSELLTGDFDATLAKARRDDFVYIDPPYTSTSRTTYGEYGYGAFATADVERLVTRLHSLTALGAKVLFSYAVDEEVIRALKGWNIASVPVRRRVAGGSRSSQAFEILASNFAAIPQRTG